MELFVNWAQMMKEENSIHSFFRFQGGLSKNQYAIKKEHVACKSNHFIYFSSNERHHKYYTKRRINQMLEQSPQDMICFSKGNDILNKSYLKSFAILEKAKKNIKDSNSFPKIQTFQFLFSESLFQTISQNTVLQTSQNKNVNLPERVDLRKKDGGFGLKHLWLELFNLSLLGIEVKTFSKEDLETYYYALTTAKDKTVFYESEPHFSRTQVFLPDTLDSSFTKYKIADKMEQIYDAGYFISTSTFAKKPRETIHEVTSEYQRNKELAVKLLEKSL